MAGSTSKGTRSGSARPETSHRSNGPHSPQGLYRPGVGILLLNEHGEVFVGRRSDARGDTWQVPQGGIEPGESPRAAALRELEEEIGTDHVSILAESERWFQYDVPRHTARRSWPGRWRGQRQKWFVMLFKGKDSEIRLGPSEFEAWRWVPLDALPELVVSFKQRLYADVVREFAALFARTDS
jgi:putative (di)nucleoside polyphosphate hydrolase